MTPPSVEQRIQAFDGRKRPLTMRPSICRQPASTALRRGTLPATSTSRHAVGIHAGAIEAEREPTLQRRIGLYGACGVGEEQHIRPGEFSCC
jgi:hypothetical protein